MTASGRRVPAPADRTYRFLLRVVRFALHLLSRRTQTGSGNVPRTGPAIAAGNHLSVADPFVLAAALARCGRRPRMLAAAGLFRVPVAGPVLRRAGFVPVHRRSADPAAALAPALAALAAGQLVGLYPEGEITRREDRWPVRGRTGVVRLALDSGAPVVPVAQWGTDRLAPAGRCRRLFAAPLLRPRVGVLIGPPVDLRALLGVADAASASASDLRRGADLVMAALVAQVAELSGLPVPAGAGVEPNPPAGRDPRHPKIDNRYTTA